MGAIADAWNIVKQELADLKSQNATLQEENGASSTTLDESDLAAIAELESEAAAVSSAAPAADASAPLALPPGSSDGDPQDVAPQPAD